MLLVEFEANKDCAEPCVEIRDALELDFDDEGDEYADDCEVLRDNHKVCCRRHHIDRPATCYRDESMIHDHFIVDRASSPTLTSFSHFLPYGYDVANGLYRWTILIND